MLDALKTLFENNVVSESVRADIEEAWNKKIQENKMQVTAELREEFARKYEHDKQTMVEAIDKMLSESLADEIKEFQEDRKQLAEAKAKYAVAMRKDSDQLQRFVMEQLANEVSELYADQKKSLAKFENLENFVFESLTKEIAEFQTDKKDLAETKVKLVREAKSALNDVKKQFVENSASLVQKVVETSLNREISQLKEDITQARQNDFGRRLFEAMQQEYVSSHLNKSSETSRLLKVISEKDKLIASAKQKISEATSATTKKEAEIKTLKESVERQTKLNSLLNPLSKSQREIMTDLLESVQTSRLDAAFEKYLPTVVNEQKSATKKVDSKAQLNEGKIITGNKEKTTNSSTAGDSNVVDLQRLAGLK